MHFPITFIAVVASVAMNADAGQRCLECHEVPTPQTCLRVSECGEHEQCFVESVVTTSATLLYNVGCMSNEKCSSRKRTFDLEKRADLVTCLECCSKGDFCNVAGCGYSYVPQINRGPYCFHCDVQESQQSCLDVAVCGQDEVCLLEPNLDFLPKIYYRSKCLDKAACLGAEQIHDNGNAPIDPSGLLVGKRNTEYGDCPACCNTDFCNNNCTRNNSVAIHGTQAPMTTQSVTHVHSEHTSIHNPKTTHAHTTAIPHAITTHSVFTKTTATIAHRNNSVAIHGTQAPMTTKFVTHAHSEHTSIHTPKTTHAQTTAMPHAITTHTVFTKTIPTTTPIHHAISSTHSHSNTHAVQDCSKNGYGYVQTRHLCLKFRFDMVDFNHATETCAREGALLVTIDTEEKMSEVRTELHTISGYIPDLWIGGNDVNHNDTFYWQTGNKVRPYTNWGTQPQQPNDPHYHDQDCIILHRADNYTWYDEPCSRVYGFICEHPLHASHTSTPHSHPCDTYPGFQLLEHNLACVEYVRTPMDWSTANNYCRKSDSHLVTIESGEKERAIFRFMQAHNAVNGSWLGLVSTRQGTQDRHDWHWQTGLPYTYSHWDHADPDGDGNCAIIHMSGHWRDRACTEHHSFVCEKNPS